MTAQIYAGLPELTQREIAGDMTITPARLQREIHTPCSKPDCYFCFKTKPHIKPELTHVPFMQAIYSPYNRPWMPHEDQIVIENNDISTFELKKLLKGRTFRAVSTHRMHIRRRYGLPVLRLHYLF